MWLESIAHEYKDKKLKINMVLDIVFNELIKCILYLIKTLSKIKRRKKPVFIV